MTIKTFMSLTIILLFTNTSISFAITTETHADATKKLTALVNQYGGRLGVYAINTGNGDRFSYHANSRFPLCSTAKVMTVGAILKNSMQTPALLNKTIQYSKKTVAKSGYAPITSKHIHSGMTIKALCAAAISYSDNAAENLLIQQLGDPKNVTHFAREIGDHKFDLTRWEPELNTAIPGDTRDTSTPKAVSESLQKLLLNNSVLANKQRKLLTQWLIQNTTGNARIRAGTPKKWIVGDKTGTGGYGTTNDIAIIWPPHCQPIVIAVYYTQNTKNARPNNIIIATTARIMINSFTRNDRCVSEST